VTIQRVKHCRDSAERWAKILPWYANTMQRRADAWAMAAGIIAAVTGVAIWPVISDTSSAWEKAVVSAGALAAAVCALPPRIKNHGEWAARARAIAGRYGEIGGELEDLQAAYERAPHSVDDATARKTVEKFEALKSLKDQLRGLPTRDFEPRDLRWQRL